jgi:predicted transcriptional regulator
MDYRVDARRQTAKAVETNSNWRAKVELQEHVAEIVSAYPRKNPVPADQLTATITARL